MTYLTKNLAGGRALSICCLLTKVSLRTIVVHKRTDTVDGAKKEEDDVDDCSLRNKLLSQMATETKIVVPIDGSQVDLFIMFFNSKCNRPAFWFTL
jgi:hypothetical protein